MALKREQIVAAEDIRRESVPVPEWKGDVWVRVMTGTERDAFGKSIISADGKPDMTKYRLGLVATCMVDDDGAPLFGLDELADLGRKSASAIDRVYRVAERLNGTGSEAEAAVKAAEGN